MTDKTHPTATIPRDEIKDCPFCGSKPQRNRYGKLGCSNYDKCGCSSWNCYSDEEWNTRTPTIPAGYVLVPVEPTDAKHVCYFCRKMKPITGAKNCAPDAASGGTMKQACADCMGFGFITVPTPPSNGGWRPIEEAKKDGTSFLAYSKDSISIDWKDKRQHKNSPFFWREYPTDRYTHFMPLPFPPEPPKEGSK